MQGDFDVLGAGDDMVVGQDVAVGRNNDAGADAVFKLRLLGLHLHVLATAKHAAEGATGAEELLQLRRNLLALLCAGLLLTLFGGLLGGGRRGHGDVDDGGLDAGRKGLHRRVERGERGDAAAIDWRGCGARTQTSCGMDASDVVLNAERAESDGGRDEGGCEVTLAASN